MFDSNYKIRFLYNEIISLLQNPANSSDLIIIESQSKKISLKTNVKIALFISHTPCGDASIIPKTDKRKNEEEDLNLSKRIKTDTNTNQIEDIYRTGAKCVPNSEVQDLKEKGVNYHGLGALRTKPGRGDPTISMSCSDKIAKWLVLGIQGSLMSSFLEKPIYLDAIIISK